MHEDVFHAVRVAGANAPSSVAESHDHGAHGATGPATIGASIAPASGLKVGEPATFTLSLVAKDGKPVTLSDLSVAHTEKTVWTDLRAAAIAGLPLVVVGYALWRMAVRLESKPEEPNG